MRFIRHKMSVSITRQDLLTKTRHKPVMDGVSLELDRPWYEDNKCVVLVKLN